MVKTPPANAGEAGSNPGQEGPLQKEWLPVLALLPEKVHGHSNLAGYSPWAAKSWI